jgi:type IV secretion system protein VirB8
MVRFDTQRRDANGRTYPAEPCVTVVRYSYSGEPMSVADRMINPLGFKVSSYRKSAEALPQASAPEAASQGGTGAATPPPAQAAP